MKRSEINSNLAWAKKLMEHCKFKLPPFAFWSLEDWESKGHECDEIRRNMLGWDITDFGLGEFDKYGLTLFTLRNGNDQDPYDPKPYAEKIMAMRSGQICLTHFHWKKIEDIINRGGGDLVIQLYNATEEDKIDEESPVQVSVDGVARELSAGAEITLSPGESITLTPRLYHKFWSAPDTGAVLIGEVSAVNDDNTDNCFAEKVGRFPEIEEDEPPLHLLCNEYPKAV
ncbi:MAG: D-lyxose/D-mannose family sugar isomerase [Planctomycetes bacterium]|nr:D-lyxose/D-mannose family sugar isomerase [Planctomycetota bacterium]